VKRATLFLMLACLAGTALGCASSPGTPLLRQYSLASGYRFPRITPAPRNSDGLFVVLALSGGGTRSAALSYGVLQQLANITVHVDADGTIIDCTQRELPECTASERTLLDEVDVISSVSGGSFTAAYYALNGAAMLQPTDPFVTRFLHHDVQRDLFAGAVYYPNNWQRLASRVEIAARYYDKHLFHGATFATLEARQRPFIILNADDMSTGNRFEFTQEQFDLLCGDLSAFPVARAVAASSAFSGLLNSMTIDSHNGDRADTSPCQYSGPGSGKSSPDWVQLALKGKDLDRRRYQAAQDLLAYRDGRRRHLHLLDGSLADNIGLRSVLQALWSSDRPSQPAPPGSTEPNAQGGRLVGGWSLQAMMNDRAIKTLIVIAVNARTEKTKDWDTRRRGPSTFTVLGSTSGNPMSNFSRETLDVLSEEAARATRDFNVPIYGFEVVFDDIADPRQREFFLNLPSSFGLTRLQADCLIDRGPRLLRQASTINQDRPRSFERVLVETLHARVTPVPQTIDPTRCVRPQ
jgi:NTE family protein